MSQFVRAVGIMAAISVCATPALALTEVHTVDFSFPLSPNTMTVLIDQFDTQGGQRILEKVTMEIEGMISVDVTVENNSPLPGEASVKLEGLLFAVHEELFPIDFDSFQSLSMALAPTDFPLVTPPSARANGQGPDFHDFGTVSMPLFDTDMTTNELSSYEGTGQIPVVIGGAGRFSIEGTTDSTMTVDFFKGEGTVTVKYDYIPEPGTLALALAGVGALGVLGHRRRI